MNIIKNKNMRNKLSYNLKFIRLDSSIVLVGDQTNSAFLFSRSRLFSVSNKIINQFLSIRFMTKHTWEYH